MSEKVKITICTGTTCYVMGGAELLMLEECIPTEWKKLIEINASPCFEVCNQVGAGKAPFMEIDGETISQANLTVAVERLREKLTQKGLI